MGEDKMRDTLDLKQLATEIDQRKRLTKQVIRLNCGLFIGIFLLPVILLFGVAAALISGNKGLADLFEAFIDRGTILLLVVSLIAYFSYSRIRWQWVRLAQPQTARLATLLGEPINLRESAGFFIWFLGLVWIVITAAPALDILNSDGLALIGFSLIYGRFLYFLIRVRLYYWGPLSRADYDGAMRLNHLFLQLNSRDTFSRYYKGYITYLSGRLNLLDSILRDNLRQSQKTMGSVHWVTTNLIMLADAHIEQEDFVTAQEALEIAARMKPDNYAIYTNMAVLYLVWGKEPERALELLDFYMSHAPMPPKNNGTLLRSVQAGIKLFEAQACWLTGRVTRCNTAVELALDLIDPRHKPLTATAYVSLSNLWQMQGDTTKARNYCQKALTLDPHGLAGQHARKLLDQLNNPSSTGNLQPETGNPET
jgi:tetratricopeptide (TPR) repeat protein